MKTSIMICLFIILNSAVAFGQYQHELPVEPATNSKVIATDSLYEGGDISLGSAVISFDAAIILPNGTCIEKHYINCNRIESHIYKSGTIILVTNAVAMKDNRQIKLATKKYVIMRRF
jgi:hypothetical protein